MISSCFQIQIIKHAKSQLILLNTETRHTLKFSDTSSFLLQLFVPKKYFFNLKFWLAQLSPHPAGQPGNGDSGERNNRWDMSPLPGPRPMPILPRPATAYSDFQPYSSPLPCPAASRTKTPTANMLTVKNQSGPQTIKASRPPTSLPVGSNYPVSVVTSQQPPALPSAPTCMHSKLGQSTSVPVQPLSTGKQVIGNNSVPLASIVSEPQQDPKNNNVLMLQTSSWLQTQN